MLAPEKAWVSDREILEELFSAHRDRVYRLCMARLKDPYDAEDAVQEVFIRAARYVDMLRTEPDPIRWLSTVARNICYDEQRRRQKTGGAGQLVERIVDLSPESDPERLAVEAMTIQHLLDRLTPAERGVVKEKVLGDLTLA